MDKDLGFQINNQGFINESYSLTIRDYYDIVTLMKLVKSLALPLLIALIFILSAKNAEASNLYLIPNPQNLKIGDKTQVTIKLNTQEENVNALAANLSFNADKLEVEAINTTNVFPILAEQAIEGNLIRLAQGSVNPISGDVSIATITFKVKGSGSANLSFKEGSAAPRFTDSSDSLNLIQSQGTILNITDSMVINEAGPSAIPVAIQTRSQTLSFVSIWNLVLNWFNS